MFYEDGILLHEDDLTALGRLARSQLIARPHACIPNLVHDAVGHGKEAALLWEPG